MFFLPATTIAVSPTIPTPSPSFASISSFFLLFITATNNKTRQSLAANSSLATRKTKSCKSRRISGCFGAWPSPWVPSFCCFIRPGDLPGLRGRMSGDFQRWGTLGMTRMELWGCNRGHQCDISCNSGVCLIKKNLTSGATELRDKLIFPRGLWRVFMHDFVWGEVYSLHPSVVSSYTNFINCVLLNENDDVVIKLECGALDFISYMMWCVAPCPGITLPCSGYANKPAYSS